MTCSLINQSSDDRLPALEITEVGTTLAICLVTNRGTLTYTSRNEEGLLFFLQDVAASAVTVSGLKNRLCLEVKYQRKGLRDYYINIDTPLAIGFECILLYLTFKPRRSSSFAVSADISIMDSDPISIDTTQDSLRQFGHELVQIVEHHGELQTLRYVESEPDISEHGCTQVHKIATEIAATTQDSPTISLPLESEGPEK